MKTDQPKAFHGISFGRGYLCNIVKGGIASASADFTPFLESFKDLPAPFTVFGVACNSPQDE
jgi:hypothetical protein